MKIADINLLKHKAKVLVKNASGKVQLYDPIRKKYVAATPEEWVRQLFIQYLMEEKNINKNRIAVEKQLTINGLQKRFDILIYDELLNPLGLIECKAPSVSIIENTFFQASTYNLALKAPFLTVTNGVSTYHCAIDFSTQAFRFLPELLFG
jgi:type I site-specific restriction-modification system R (restriction) subunit